MTVHEDTTLGAIFKVPSPEYARMRVGTEFLTGLTVMSQAQVTWHNACTAHCTSLAQLCWCPD